MKNKIIILFTVGFMAIAPSSAQGLNDGDDFLQNNPMVPQPTPQVSAPSESTDTSKKEEMLGIYNLAYYNFSDVVGKCNYGISTYFLRPNGIGGEFNIRLTFKKYGNYSVDLGPNYTFKLWGNDNSKLLFTVAAGPSIRKQEVLKYSSSYREETKDRWYVDLFINPRIGFNYKGVVISGGYFLWTHKFKFGKDERIDGFNVALGCTL